jgi:hypothetical protein
VEVIVIMVKNLKKREHGAGNGDVGRMTRVRVWQQPPPFHPSSLCFFFLEYRPDLGGKKM